MNMGPELAAVVFCHGSPKLIDESYSVHTTGWGITPLPPSRKGPVFLRGSRLGWRSALMYTQRDVLGDWPARNDVELQGAWEGQKGESCKSLLCPHDHQGRADRALQTQTTWRESSAGSRGSSTQPFPSPSHKAGGCDSPSNLGGNCNLTEHSGDLKHIKVMHFLFSERRNIGGSISSSHSFPRSHRGVSKVLPCSLRPCFDKLLCLCDCSGLVWVAQNEQKKAILSGGRRTAHAAHHASVHPAGGWMRKVLLSPAAK